MAISLSEYSRLKKKAEELKAKVQRAQGTIDSHTETLKEKFDCKTLDQAKKLRESLVEELEDAQTAFEESLKGFKTKWASQLD